MRIPSGIKEMHAYQMVIQGENELSRAPQMPLRFREVFRWVARRSSGLTSLHPFLLFVVEKKQ